MIKTREDVSISSLKDAPHNPPNRITAANIRTLRDSMESLGLLQPITIGLDRVIIEGHRRVAAAKALGWKVIEANIIKEADNDAIYGSLNTTSRKLSGYESLYVWLKNKNAVVKSQQRAFEEMEEVLGRVLVKQICERGFSRRLYNTSKQIAAYCEISDHESVREIARWLLTFPVIGQVQRAMTDGASPKNIMKAIKANKPVKLELAIG